MPIVGDDEAVQIRIKSVLDGAPCDFRHQPAHVSERGAVKSDPLADRAKLERGLSRMLAAAAADMDSELARERLEAPLQRADHARGDAGGVPVHAHDRAERLEPERMGEATQQLVAAVSVDDRLADDGSEPGHAVREPQRRPPAVQRQIGASCSSGHAVFRDSLYEAQRSETEPASLGLSTPTDGTADPISREAFKAHVARQRQSLLPKLSSMAYPAPRTVRIGSRCFPFDNLLRRRPICTSTVRSSTSATRPQTRSSSCARENTRPGFSSRYSSSRKSIGPRLISRSPRRTRPVSRSRSRSPT